MPLSNGEFAQVSDEDWMACLAYTWHRHGCYASAYMGGGRAAQKYQLLHKFVAARAGLIGEIDHEDQDGLNCQRHNLRAATRTLNNANRAAQHNNQLGVKGVTSLNGRYRATIGYKGRSIHLGMFDTIGEASEAYYKAAKKHFGDFARQ